MIVSTLGQKVYFVLISIYLINIFLYKMKTASVFMFTEIRAMGETLVNARRLCQESQYEKGIPLFKNALELLGKFIQALENISERQKWLQVHRFCIVTSL